MQGLSVIMVLLLLVSCVGQEVSSKRGDSASAATSNSKNDDSKNNTGLGNFGKTSVNSNGESVILGQITAADGVTPLAGASVYMLKGSKKVKLKNAQDDNDNYGNNDKKDDDDKDDENEEECKSDNNGRFACKGIEDNGKVKFRIEKPKVVEKEFEAEVKDDVITEVKKEDTRVERKQMTSKWLVVPGQYDGVQLLLSQLKGCKLTGNPSVSAELRKSVDCESAGLSVLNDSEIQQKFNDLTFLNQYQFIFINCPTNMGAYGDRIQQYVKNGGHIYFSDWAASGLDSTFPGNIQFGLKNTDGGVVNSTVLNSGLKNYLGRSNVPIYFDYNAWVPIDSVNSNVQTYIKGNTEPLGGKNDAAITVGWKQEDKGCVFFTSYHIEGASTGANQERSLKYLLMNIDHLCL